MSVRIIHGDCRAVLPTLAAGSFDCVVTSPPYWGLRDYGVAGQIGLEATLTEYVDTMARVFDELHRVLKSSGTCWLNLGDVYATGAGKVGDCPGGGTQGERFKNIGPARPQVPDGKNPNAGIPTFQPNRMPQAGLKPKDLCGVPWRVVFALQERGWWLRSAIVWAKPNPMPESVTDRPTSAYEMVFLLTKSERYWYDADAIREEAQDRPFDPSAKVERDPSGMVMGRGHNYAPGASGFGNHTNGRNARNVWTIATHPYRGSHFATMPPDLAERCIKAGCPLGGHVLDPFGGAGTTGLVADRLGRSATLIELNSSYQAMGAARISDDCPLFADVDSPPSPENAEVEA